MPVINNINQLPVQEMIATASREPLGMVRSLSEVGQLSNLLIHHEVLLPQRRAATPHHHTLKEELFLVLEGQPSIWLDDELHQLKPGDFVGCPAGEGVAHTVINTSETQAVILTIGTRPDDDVTVFVKTP